MGRVGEEAVLRGAEADVLGRGGHQGGDETAVGGQVGDRHVEAGQTLQGLGGDLDVAEDDDLADRGDRDAVDLRAVMADDQMLAPLADVRAGLVQVEHGAVVVLGHDAGHAGGRGGWGLGVADGVEGLLGQADRRQRAAVAAVPEFARAGARAGCRGRRGRGSWRWRRVFWRGETRRAGRPPATSSRCSRGRLSGPARRTPLPAAGPGRRAGWRRSPRRSGGRRRRSAPMDRLYSIGRVTPPRSSIRSSLPEMPSRSELRETLRVCRASPSLRVRFARAGSLTRRCWNRPSSTCSLVGITDSTYSR